MAKDESQKKAIPAELAGKIFTARHNVQAREKDVAEAKESLKAAKDTLEGEHLVLGSLIDEAEKGAGPLYDEPETE